MSWFEHWMKFGSPEPRWQRKRRLAQHMWELCAHVHVFVVDIGDSELARSTRRLACLAREFGIALDHGEKERALDLSIAIHDRASMIKREVEPWLEWEIWRRVYAAMTGVLRENEAFDKWLAV